jgi:glutamate--cysteine ligase
LNAPGFIDGALRALDTILTDQKDRIEDLLAYHRNQVICPVYTSVDIRRNRNKAAVVDANAFPAGFNNLSERSYEQAANAVGHYMARVYPGAKDILILGESHTRNKWYFQNLRALRDLFRRAGYQVTLGTLAEELFPQADVQTALGHTITLHGVLREGDALIADGIVHDVVVLNNDLSGGTPDLLDGIDQPITPPPAMGWHRRRKSEHFRIVNQLAKQLGEYAGFDPWLISAEYEVVVDVDFKARAHLDTVAAKIDEVIARVQAKYDQYGVDRQPHVFVKADAGTYGMGVMDAKSGADFLELNSKGREKMAKGKEGVKTSSVIIQEGVHSGLRARVVSAGETPAKVPPHAAPSDSLAVAEPVMYMVCGAVIGGFNRLHQGKSDTQSLNAPGSTFQPMAFTTQVEAGAGEDETVLDEVSRHVYQVLGEIASIATGYECKLMETPGAALPHYP